MNPPPPGIKTGGPGTTPGGGGGTSDTGVGASAAVGTSPGGPGHIAQRMYLSRRGGAAPGYGDRAHPGGIGGGRMPGAIAFSSELGDGSPGMGGTGNGNAGVGSTGGEIAAAGGAGGRSNPPTRFPTAGIADAIFGISAASGPNP